MSKYKELVYMVLDSVKIVSDDSIINEDHVIFLLNKYRAFLIKQKYENAKNEIPQSMYQTLCLTLNEVPAIPGVVCSNSTYLKSDQKVPDLLPGIGTTTVYPYDYYSGNIAFISRERMKYVGHNRFLPNMIYCSIGPDHYLYFKSDNPQFQFLKKVSFTGVFEDPDKAAEVSCEEKDEDGNNVCDIMDKNFPIEEDMIPQLLELVTQQVLGAAYRPADTSNNAQDDTSNLATYIARNAKSSLAKQISE